MTSADVIVTSASVCAVDVAVFGSGQPIAYRAGRLVLVSIGSTSREVDKKMLDGMAPSMRSNQVA